jgi:hypothetical protein
MKRYILPFSLALAAVAVPASAKTTLDGQAQAYVDLYNQMQLNPGASLALPPIMPFELNPKSRTAPQATVIVTLADGVSASDIEAQGFSILAQAGNMVIVSGSIEDIVALGETDLAKVISFGSKADPTLNHARMMTNMDAVHNGEGNLPQGYDGTGIICGIYDIGFDALHPNFNKKDDQNVSRLQRVWRFGSSDGSYTEFTNENLSKYTIDTTDGSHGTHTVGCMAGAHNEQSSSNNQYAYWDDENGKVTVNNAIKKGKNPYYGMAPGASVVVGAGGLYDDNILVGISKMADYAKAENKPLVISLSFGNNIGSHDEYDTFTSYLDNIAKDAIVCISAGNEGAENLSIVKDLTSSDKQVKTYLDWDGSVQGYIDIYSKDSTPFTVTPFIYDYVSDKIVYEKDVTDDYTIHSDTDNNYAHSSAFTNAFSSSYLSFVVDKHESTSNRYSVRMTYKLTYNSTDNLRKYRVLGFLVKGSAGQRVYITRSGDVEFTPFDFKDCDTASPNFSINGMACGKNVICVGAHYSTIYVPMLTSSKTYYWPNETQGGMAYFTSYGELYDGRRLPHVCAPGTNINSSVSSYDATTTYSKDNASAMAKVNGRTYYWAAEDGTSMATPILAGALATWCQAYPQLTGEQALQIIQETATKDELVETTGTALQWGAGRFNALAGLQKLLNIDGVKNITAESEDIIITNNGNNVFQAFVAGASQVNAQLYNMAGQLVANVSAKGDTVDLDASNLTKGIYIIKVNNNHAQRVVLN